MRGFWTELPPNDKNKFPKNSPVYKSSCLVFTTDVRMDKVVDLFPLESLASKGSGGSGGSFPDQKKITRTGGGGRVEACFWIKEAKTQWRVAGRAWVLFEGDVDEAEDVKQALLERMEKVDKKDDDWSWKTEVLAIYGNLSPGMRGKFLMLLYNL
jgi:pyridoxamine 5'-phosphate oxidase